MPCILLLTCIIYMKTRVVIEIKAAILLSNRNEGCYTGLFFSLISSIVLPGGQCLLKSKCLLLLSTTIALAVLDERIPEDVLISVSPWLLQGKAGKMPSISHVSTTSFVCDEKPWKLVPLYYLDKFFIWKCKKGQKIKRRVDVDFFFFFWL